MNKRRNFTPEQKAKIVLEVLREEKTLNEVAAEYEIHPNMISPGKQNLSIMQQRYLAKKPTI
jgi:transposase-like protein